MVRNKIPGSKQEHGSHHVLKSKTSILTGIGLSLLMHAIGFWFLIERVPSPAEMPPAEGESRLTISLAPPMPGPAPQPKALPPPAPKSVKPAKPVARQKQAGKPVIDSGRAQAKVLVPPLAAAPRQEPAQPDIAPADDMFTHLQAARKRRAEAKAQEGLPEEPALASREEGKSDNSIALANIASSLNRARRNDQADSGGVFQLRRVGYRDAEVFFRGWSPNAGRERTRLIPVERGAESDIQTAVVKKMIEVIREERDGDFTWESHRLGKLMTLSARPQDSAALQQFLMKEFFPDYVPVVSNQ